MLDYAETDAGIRFDFLLQIFVKLFVTLGGHDGQRFDFKAVQTLALLVHTQAQPAPDGLAALAFRAHVAQRANLEHIGIRGARTLSSLSAAVWVAP